MTQRLRAPRTGRRGRLERAGGRLRPPPAVHPGSVARAAISRWCSARTCSPTTARSTTTRRCAPRLPGPWRSSGDTEVLLHLLARDGSRLPRSAWSACSPSPVWDAAARRLLLARDRLGIKPLYYRLLPDGIAFASELKALLRARQAADRSRARCATFCSTAISRHRRSIYRGIAKLPAGHTLDLAGRARAHRALLEPVDRHRASARASDTLQQLDALLREVVPAHTLSDVPVGVFLSGGIDSALTAYYLDAPRTYTLGFDARGALRSSTPRAARAAHLHTVHTEMTAQAGGLRAGARAHAGALR